MPSCSCHPGISLAPRIVSISWCWWRSEAVGHSAGQWAGLALYQNAAWLGENRTLSLSNGIMGQEGVLKSSSGQLVTHHCSFSLSPVLLFFICVPLVDSLQDSSLPSPYRCPCCASSCLYMVRCIQSTFNPLGLVQGPCSFCRRQFQPPL